MSQSCYDKITHTKFSARECANVPFSHSNHLAQQTSLDSKTKLYCLENTEKIQRSAYGNLMNSVVASVLKTHRTTWHRKSINQSFKMHQKIISEDSQPPNLIFNKFEHLELPSERVVLRKSFRVCTCFGINSVKVNREIYKKSYKKLTFSFCHIVHLEKWRIVWVIM